MKSISLAISDVVSPLVFDVNHCVKQVVLSSNGDVYIDCKPTEEDDLLQIENLSATISQIMASKVDNLISPQVVLEINISHVNTFLDVRKMLDYHQSLFKECGKDHKLGYLTWSMVCNHHLG
jgi:hypothetical protein